MQALNIWLPGVMTVVSLAAILIVLLLTILRLLRAASFFQSNNAVIMALCISLLFIVGISQLLLVPTVIPGNVGSRGAVSHLLLPYLALAVAAAVVLSQVLLLASKILPSEELSAGEQETDVKEFVCSPAKPKPGRPKKKDKPAEKESKEALEPVGSLS